jgi:uncharacterized membrane protein YeaQ/YmgE (transglycosylase-associated protein family)
MNFETIVITAVFGALAGWLTGVVTKRGGYDLVEETALGVVGGVAGGFALWMQRIAPADSQLAMSGAAFAGAFILVIARRMFWNVETAVTQ